MEYPHITIEQWRALIAVVDAGSYAKASEMLNKSQSAITYAVQKIEELLGVKAFVIEGRKAVLTPTGQMLYRRALALVSEAGDLERAAKTLSAGWEAEIGIAVEILFPSWLLFRSLARLGETSPRTRVEVIESVMGGTPEALISGRADIAITASVPHGFLGESLMRQRLIVVAHPDHPLHAIDRPLTQRDLKDFRHLTVRDSGEKRDRRAVSIEVEQRWTVSHLATSIEAVSAGHGFAWLPDYRIRDQLAAGVLKPLNMREGAERFVELNLVLADPDLAGPGVRRLAEIIREDVAEICAKGC